MSHSLALFTATLATEWLNGCKAAASKLENLPEDTQLKPTGKMKCHASNFKTYLPTQNETVFSNRYFIL